MKNKIKIENWTDDELIERLRKNPKEREQFKNCLIKEYKKDRDLNSLLSCLRIVVSAERGSATKIAKNSGMHRMAIYKALKPDVLPRFDTVQNILNGLGLTLTISKLHKKIA